jgi:ElaB/YqjD/DUF883 family membrane-anchored ribosome-binding protein
MKTTNKLPHENGQATELISKKVGQLKIAERQLVKDCRAYVQGNPVASLSVAVAIGFVLSRVLSRHKTICPVVDAK